MRIISTFYRCTIIFIIWTYLLFNYTFENDYDQNLPENIQQKLNLFLLDESSDQLCLEGTELTLGHLCKVIQLIRDKSFKLKHLNLSLNQLSALPKSFTNLTALETLNLFSNQLQALPDGIENLKSLKKLDLCGSQLQALPDGIGNLEALTDLRVPLNQLQALPESLRKLTALEHLDVSSNRLQALPDGIGNLEALTDLDVSSNRLQAMNEYERKLTAFQDITIYNNQFKKTPPSVAQTNSFLRYANQHQQLTDPSKNELRPLKKLFMCLGILALPFIIDRLR